VQSAAAQVEAICATEGEGSTACQEGRAVVAEADALFLALSHTFTASPVFALDGSDAAAAVTGRVEEIRAALAALGGSFQTALPLALTPLEDVYRHDMLQESVSGIAAYHGEGWWGR